MASVKKDIRLNLGCGENRVSGFVGVDLYPCDGMDVQHDLNMPLPFPDDCAREVRAHHIIEHVKDPYAFLKEVHRVSKNDALVSIVTPHFASMDSFIDITHLFHMSCFSLDKMCGNECHYQKKMFSQSERRLAFGVHPMGLIGRVISMFSMREYEQRWCYVFRPTNIYWKLRVVK
jgi:ubiquinone/menaquinone biosynthesis C-methylase UbiE